MVLEYEHFAIMCSADSFFVRHNWQTVLVVPPYFVILSAVHSLFCKISQQKNSTFDFHSAAHSKSAKDL
jgi:hypothetical protein